MFPNQQSLSEATLCLNEPNWNYMDTSTELYRSNLYPGTKESLVIKVVQTSAVDLLPFSFVKSIPPPPPIRNECKVVLGGAQTAN